MAQEKLPIFKPADRIADFKPYFFASLAKKLAELKKKGMDIIRIDIGSPDLPPEGFIIEKLVSSAHRPDAHGYTPNGGTPAFHQAVANYYGQRFNVELDAETETLALIGSKEGLFNLAQVIINPGDVVLVPDPGYPVYNAGSLIAGAKVVLVPLLEENGYLPELESIPYDIVKQAKILWLNYPNNPTGAIASLDFFKKAIDFGKKNHILIAHDAPYTDVCFDGYRAPSILQIPGAKEIAIEFNSLSKTYNMAGWRLGMAVGNPEVIEYLHTYKSQMDSSHFAPIIEAGITALSSDQGWLEDRNLIYLERRDIVVEGLKTAGFRVNPPPAAIYVWAGLPKGFHDSTKFCDKLLTETGVSATPGIVYGQYGEGYLRVSLGTATNRIKQAIERIVAWMKLK
jgi:LL-diaminopimelate aminotransferase